MISLGLAAFNIFRFEFGRRKIAVLLVEKIKGSPLSLKAEMYIFGLSFAFLMTAALLVTIKILWRCFKFWVFIFKLVYYRYIVYAAI